MAVVTEYASCTDCCGPPDCNCTPPATLYVDITGCSGWELTAEPLTQSGSQWVSASDPSAQINLVTLECVTGEWQIILNPVNVSCGPPTVQADVGSCDPFYLEFTMSLDSTCCPASGGTLAITVSE